MTDEAIRDLRADIGRLEVKLDDLRDLKPTVVNQGVAILALQNTIHGSDGSGGLLIGYVRIEQQMKAILWTVRTIGTATLVTLVAIFWKLAQGAV